jgi:hypothetical protein
MLVSGKQVESGDTPLTLSANKLVPLSNHGIQTMSIGYLLPPDPNTPVVWRGLMVQKAVQQMLFDVDWAGDQGDLDVLVIDMPPGTGDVQLSLGQLVLVDGELETYQKLTPRRGHCVDSAGRRTHRRAQGREHVQQGQRAGTSTSLHRRR